MERLRNFKELEDDFIHALLSINTKKAEQIIRELTQRESFVNIGDGLIAPALAKTGKSWEDGSTAISQVYLSAHICNKILDKLLPDKEFVMKEKPRLGIATLGDFHSLGKKVVTYSLKAAGYNITDFGLGLLIHDIVEKCRKNKTEILLISALMLPSALLIKQLIEALEEGNLHIKVIVGGAPFCFDRDLWREVGAYAMGYNASDAIGIVKRITKEMK